MLRPAEQSSQTSVKVANDVPALSKLGIVVRFGRHETIFNQGDEAKYSYRLVSGAVRHSKFLVNGRRQIADFSLPGEYFGFQNDCEHSLTAEALSDVVVVRYPRSHVERLGEEVADVRRELMLNLRRELMMAQEHLVMLGRQSAKERVASFIVALANRVDAGNGDTITLPMGRQDIADYLGLTIETVCRAISDLKQCGVIKVPNRHELVLLRLDVLEALASGESDED